MKIPLISKEHAAARVGVELVGALMVVALLLGFAVATLHIKVDDSYIFFTYVRHILSGDGYVFNLGERVNGTTSSLYPLLVALFSLPWRADSWDVIPWVGHVLGWLSLSAALLMIYHLLQQEGFKLAALVAPLLLLANRLFLAGVGMESFLSIGLMLGAVLLYRRERYGLTGAVLGLAVLSRPDTLLLSALILIHFLATRRRMPPALVFITFGLVLTPWLVFSQLYFGELFPNTLGAKLAQTVTGRWGTGLIFLSGLRRPWQSNDLPLLILASVSVLSLLLKPRLFKRSPCTTLFSLWGALYLLIYGFILNPPAYGWYYTPLVVPMTLLMALGFEGAMERFGLQNSRRISVVSLLLTASLPSVLLLAEFRKPLNAKYDIYKRAAGWLNSNVPVGSSVAANEIGVLGYYYRNGRVIDALGLVTRGAAQHIRNRNYSWYIQEHHPDYLMFNNPPRATLEEFAEADWFKAQYSLVMVIKSQRNPKGVRIYKRIA